ncbi:MAG: calcium:sodium antiporter [Gemmatimonas sp.]|jgi:cation:H+ antiporter|uniref:sodium:calcium antiporter n=1 Tax=Gemmatimonas sp. UBA7669 TaxID=1946568 RepID=UPI0025B97E6B|nr:sodium:calcium antiporter [Gemmatimonas sp. UBA7669]MBA3917607.1 calcium:sodium antiporter [Gemmatimonas sp.]
MSVWSSLVQFALALALLLAAARFFTNAAQRVGLAFGMSPFVVGVFIIAIGTSLPELVASLLSVREGASEIVPGNVLGANAANLLLNMGLVSALATGGRIVLGEEYLFIDLHFLMGAMLAVATTMADGRIVAIEGGLLLLAYALYMTYLVVEGRTPSAEAEHADAMSEVKQRRASLARDAGILVVAGVLIYVGGDMTVRALQDVSLALGISAAVASVTILSIGTSLPELVVSVSAARAGQASMAVGNVLGSCVFNALAVAGAAGLASGSDGVVVTDALRYFALPFVGASALLFYLLTQDKRISRWEGMLFLILFLLFMVKMGGLA